MIKGGKNLEGSKNFVCFWAVFLFLSLNEERCAARTNIKFLSLHMVRLMCVNIHIYKIFQSLQRLFIRIVYVHGCVYYVLEALAHLHVRN